MVWLFSAGMAAQDLREVVGYVIAFDGHWSIPGRADQVTLGQPVFDGDVLQASGTSTQSTYITVALLDGSAATSDCRRHQDCGRLSIGLSNRPAEPWKVRVVRAIGDLFRHRQLPRIIALTRSQEPPREAVLASSGGRLDLRESFAGLPVGRYRIILSPQTGSTPAQFTATLRCDVRRSCSTNISGLRPGVYELEVHDSNDDTLGSPVFVLVVTKKRYSNAATRFLDAQRIVQGWDTDVRGSAVRYFLTAALFSLESDK
jgi:hypothetical protein